MKKTPRRIILIAVILIGIIYIIISIAKSSPKKNPARSPSISGAPARVYGTVEPEGGEVYVSPPITRNIVKIYAKEGEPVAKGQKLATLDNKVEQAEYDAALTRTELAQKTLELSRDKYERNKSLVEKGISELEYKQLKLAVELDSLNLLAALSELDLAKARLEQLDLKSPVDGVLYKFDIRLGESVAAGDNSIIIIGKPKLWVRLYVESFWSNRIKIGDVYQIKDAESNEMIGNGKVITKRPYLGSKVLKTEDIYERFDTKYQEVILEFETDKKDIPIGLSVLAEIKSTQPK